MDKQAVIGRILVGVGLYTLLPTPDEVFVHPLLGSFLARIFSLPFSQGIGISLIIYNGIGITCLISALLVGGKQVYRDLKARFARRHEIQQKPIKTDILNPSLCPFEAKNVPG